MNIISGHLSCSLVLQTGACHSEVGPWRLAGTQTLPVPGCSLPWLCVTPPAVPHSFPADECVSECGKVKDVGVRGGGWEDVCIMNEG